MNSGVHTVDLGSYNHQFKGNILSSNTSNILQSTGKVFINAPDADQIIGNSIYNLNDIEFSLNNPTAPRTKSINANLNLTGDFTAINPTGNEILLMHITTGFNFSTSGSGKTFTLGNYVRFNSNHGTTAPNMHTILSTYATVNLETESIVNYNLNGNQTIASGISYGHLRIGGNSGTKTLVGNITVKGNLTSPVNSNSVLSYNGNTIDLKGDLNIRLNTYSTVECNSTLILSGGNQEIKAIQDGALRVPNLVIAGTGVKTLEATTLNVGCDFTIQNGVTFDAGVNSINLTGNFVNTGTGIFTMDTDEFSPATITFNGPRTSDQFVSANNTTVFNRFVINKTGAGSNNNLIALTDLNIRGNTTLVNNSANFIIDNHTVKFGNNLDIGTSNSPGVGFSGVNSTVIFDAPIDQNINNYIGTAAIFHNVTFANNGIKYLRRNTFQLTGNFVMESGSVVNLNANMAEPVNIFVAGNWINNGGTLVGINRTVTFNGGNQSISAELNFPNLVISGTNTKTLQGNISVNNSLTINSGAALDVSPMNYTINVGTNWTNNGTFVHQAGTVVFSGTSSSLVNTGTTTGPNPDKEFYNVVISKNQETTTVSLLGDLIINNDLQVQLGTLRNCNGGAGCAGARNIYVNRNLVNNSVFQMNGTSSGDLLFVGNQNADFSPGNNASSVYRRIVVQKSAATSQVKLISNLTVNSGNNSTLVLNSGIFNVNGKICTFAQPGTPSVVNRIEINGGELHADAGSTIQIPTQNVLNVNAGKLKLVGTTSNNVILTRSGSIGGYIIRVNGGEIEVQNTRFEFLGYSTVFPTNQGSVGIRIDASANLTGNFSGCTFINGFSIVVVILILIIETLL